MNYYIIAKHKVMAPIKITKYYLHIRHIGLKCFLLLVKYRP